LLLVPLLFLAACEEEKKEAKPKPTEPAKIEFTLDGLRYEFSDGHHRYYHARRYTETNGTGITLTGGKVCFEDGKACLSARVRYRVDADKVLVQPDHHVATKRPTDVITIEYWGVDDAGKKLRVKRTLRVAGAKFEVE
jgi:hypothetical protein